MNILEKILNQKRLEIAALDAKVLRHAAEQSPTPRDFLAAIQRRRFGTHPSLIAELKRASPSKGILAPHLDLFQVADIYTQNGAAAISVLTDEKFFMGSLSTLRELRARNLTPDTSHLIPLLRK
ncbi:partial Indole-3-glycerol phosphate synthase, partial [Anaerolineales bacterium]